MPDQFDITADTLGNLYVRPGLVRNIDDSVVIEVGVLGGDPIFIGGSGRNLILSDFPAGGPNGVWLYHSPGKWRRGVYTLAVDGTTATISDETDAVATLSTGAPLGDYASTTYGETLLGAAFTAVADAEFSSPGTLPTATVSASEGSAAPEPLEPTGDNLWEWVGIDEEWALEIDPLTGRADLSDAAGIVATRSIGPSDDPSGIYEATIHGRLTYNAATPPSAGESTTPPASPDDNDPPTPPGEEAATDPDPDEDFPTDTPPDPESETPVEPRPIFGVLTLRLEQSVDTSEWFGLDLDSAAEVGGGENNLLTYASLTDGTSGDIRWFQYDIDLETAHDELDLSGAEYLKFRILSANGLPGDAESDWTATLIVSHLGESYEKTFTPADTNASNDPMDTVALAPWNPTPESLVGSPWRAVVTTGSTVPPEGVIYVAVHEDGGVLDSVTGPFFSDALPSNTADTFHVTLGYVTSAGIIRQLWTGTGSLGFSASPTFRGITTLAGVTEGVTSLGTVTSSATLSIAKATRLRCRLTASTACTFTMPAATDGKSFILEVEQAASTGNGTATFTGVDWGSAGAPTITATAGKMDVLTFVANGSKWFGSYAQGYTY